MTCLFIPEHPLQLGDYLIGAHNFIINSVGTAATEVRVGGVKIVLAKQLDCLVTQDSVFVDYWSGGLGGVSFFVLIIIIVLKIVRVAVKVVAVFLYKPYIAIFNFLRDNRLGIWILHCSLYKFLLHWLSKLSMLSQSHRVLQGVSKLIRVRCLNLHLHQIKRVHHTQSHIRGVILHNPRVYRIGLKNRIIYKRPISHLSNLSQAIVLSPHVLSKQGVYVRHLGLVFILYISVVYWSLNTF